MLTSHESYFAENFSWLTFYSSKKTTWQKKYKEIKEELAAALKQRDNCMALLQKMEEEHLETITKMKRHIDDLEGMLNKVFACIYSVQVVLTEKIFNLMQGRYSLLPQIVFIFNLQKKKFKKRRLFFILIPPETTSRSTKKHELSRCNICQKRLRSGSLNFVKGRVVFSL